VAVTLHEAAHGWAAWRLGDPTAKLAGRVTLNPLRHLDPLGSVVLPLLLMLSGSPFVFGYARPVPVRFRNLRRLRRDTVLVSGAGVGANITCALAFGLLFQVSTHTACLWHLPLVGGLLSEWVFFSASSVVIHCVLAVFNLLPLPPLDGGKIVAAALPPRQQLVLGRLEPLGMLVLLVLLATHRLDRIVLFFLDPLLRLCVGGEGLGFALRQVLG